MKRVVLCRPEGPRNVGMILRIARNFGPCELALVAPERASILVHPEFEQMSHGADEARAAVLCFDTLQEALAECTSSVGFSARVRGTRVRDDWRDMRGELTCIADEGGERLALVFGNEVTGLTADEAALCQRLAHVRTAKEHTSLNLAVSTAVVLADLFTGRAVHDHEPGAKMLNGDGREFLKARLKEVFAGRIARTPAAAKDITAAIDRVFSRAPLENRDARAWHLMLKALGSDMEPGDLGLRPSTKAARRKDALRKHGVDPEA
ncbi:MAG: RNA methyltransferase [bacterium]|nr:RNA methyltransferase [bacterium]